ncbi:MAG: hypothetical protein EBU33_05190, partial [Sphingobacteriia bacterium]|nr:hypothetical protein [Sphingobacteriia bacterium]
MIFRKLILVFGIFCLLGFQQGLQAQDNCIAIAINEYCPANIPNNGLTDYYGEFSDWVELKCQFSSSVSLQNYYLSNDRNNLFKWAFPKNFVMAPGQLKLVWLSGRNTTVNTAGGTEYHANFTLEQCKNQWLIISNSAGVVRDSVFVRNTMGGHSWGRVNCFEMGAGAFKLFQDGAKTPGAQNGTIHYDGYSPIYDIFYTEDGSFPIPAYPPVTPTQMYTDSLVPITISKTEVVRFIAVPNSTGNCQFVSRMLPSFCESNTYFIDPSHQLFSQDFGVMSVSMDNNWFASGGTSASSVHVEYYDNKQQISEGYAQIDRPINEAWITQFSFDTSADSFTTAEEAFQEFLDFAKAYKHDLTDQDLDVCISLSEHMADTYHHVNKKENAML